MIDFVRVAGFKSLRSIDVPLRPVNVLVGANGSGKSNFLGALAFLHSIRAGRLQDSVARGGGATNILHFGPKETDSLVLWISFNNERDQYEIHLSPTTEDALYVSSEMCYFWDKSRGYPRPYGQGLVPLRAGLEAGLSGDRLDPVSGYVRDQLDRLRVFHVHDTSAHSPLRATSQLDDNDFLRSNGANLSAFLYLLQEKHQSAYEMIRAAVQRVAPFFDNFALKPDQLNESSIKLAWLHRGSDQRFGASALSDGTLRFIALATLLLQPVPLRPGVIVVDEPELGLHPAAITLLAATVQAASKQGTQIILSTQSTLLLDHFEPEDVIVANRVGGATEFTRLSTEDLAQWLEDYSLGQLWEKNEFGGRPEREA
ncbi:AAA family ATPase [Luteitalea sp.]